LVPRFGLWEPPPGCVGVEGDLDMAGPSPEDALKEDVGGGAGGELKEEEAGPEPGSA